MTKEEIRQQIFDLYSAMYPMTPGSTEYLAQLEKINALIDQENALDDTDAPSS